jgi:hypothetical protein
MAEPVPGKRGVAAVILLVLMTIGNAGGAILVLISIENETSHGRTQQVPLLGTVLALQLIALVGLAAISTWRRWGLYLYGVTLAVNLALGLATGARLLTLLLPVAFFAVLVSLLRPRWPEQGRTRDQTHP